MHFVQKKEELVAVPGYFTCMTIPVLRDTSSLVAGNLEHVMMWVHST